MKIAVVTGASSGMGKEFVKQLQAWCKNLDEIWVIARRKEQLEALKQQGGCKIRVVDGDLLDETFMTRFQGLLLQEHPSVKILVNSAGMGRNGSVTEISRENPSIQKKMTELNTAALVEMTEAVLPYMPLPPPFLRSRDLRCMRRRKLLYCPFREAWEGNWRIERSSSRQSVRDR